MLELSEKSAQVQMSTMFKEDVQVGQIYVTLQWIVWLLRVNTGTA